MRKLLLPLTLLVPLVAISGCAGLVSSVSSNPSPSTLSITNVQATSTTTSSTQILWTTNVAANSVVNYGTTISYGSSTPVDSTMVTDHAVTISGLVAGTTYYYEVQSTDSKNNNGKSGGHKFATATVSISGTISPSNGGTGATVALSGTASATTTTNSSGVYTFAGLAGGSYTVTPSNAGYSFTPANQNVSLTTTSVTGANFSATATTSAPTITTQPANQTVAAGQTATFMVVATGTTPLSYQWQNNGTAISGAMSSSYTTQVTTTSDGGAQFTVVVSNSAGSVTSNAATLTVNAATYLLNASPTSISFGNVNLGSSSNQNVTFTNSGNSSVTVSNVTVGGPGFNVSGISTGQVIAPGQSATLAVTFAPSAPGSATGSASVSSNSSNSPATVSLTGSGMTQSASGTPTCGKSGDSSIHVPTDWGTFVPPGKGQSYVDPTYGCTVTRVTDASSEEWSATCNNGSGCYTPFSMGYATVSPFNANDSYLMLADGWNNHFVTDLSGNIVVPIGNMPGGNDGWYLWDAANAGVFYYTSGNSMMKGTISGSSVSTAVVHQFSEYGAINFMDKTDLSQDGQHVVVVGGDTSGGSAENVFVYNFVANTKGAVYTTGCVGSVGSPNNSCLHGVTQTPDNNVMIDFAGDGTCSECGNRLWDGTSPLIHTQDTTNHLDTGYDLNGNAVYIEVGNSSVLATDANPCPSGWGLDVREVYNTQSAVCLVDIAQYGQLAPWHVGYRGNANQPWVGLSFFDTRNPGPEWFDNTGNYTAPTASNWMLFEDEIIVARIDANNNPNNVYRLARAYTRSGEDFYAQPHAAISRDGKYLTFESNMAYAHTGCPAQFQTSTGCTDVYLIKVK